MHIICECFTIVGGMEQSFTDDAPLFPVFECHVLTLHSVMELHDSATLLYAAHINLVACASTDLIPACTSPMQKSGKHLFLATLTTVALPISLVASPMCPIGNPEMLSTSNFYDGNVIYVVWKDKLAWLQYNSP